MAPCTAPTFLHAEFRYFCAPFQKKSNLCIAALFLQEQLLMHGAKSGAPVGAGAQCGTEFKLNLYVPALCWTHDDTALCVSTTPHLLGCILDGKGMWD